MAGNSTQDNWDFYACQIEDKPHSTMVNLSLFDQAPIPNISVFHCIEILLKHAHPDNGMSTDQEFETLSGIDDVIDRSETQELRYVARQTGDGKRKFYFYAAPTMEVGGIIEAIRQSFPPYEIATFSFEDASWQTYFADLYPNAIALNEIGNRHVRYRLEEVGDGGTTYRTIDHTFVFDTKKQIKAFERVLKGQGFATSITSEGFWNKTYTLLAQKSDRPKGLDPVTFELNQAAAEYGGAYDGWGCVAVTDS